ncbi:MAG: ankyrin repeat domain-containing protein [Firmicutes bacterium]|nr:ankyrin repeat domain-containing protein [Bacillota bacterium]
MEAIKGDEKTFIKHAFENPDMITNKMLIFAAGSFSPKGLETLTEGGFNFNIEDGNRWNSLHSAAFQNNVEVIDFLLNNGLGAQSKADELYEYTPVDIATMGANREVLHYLLLNGGKMTHDTWKYACQEESGDAIDMLLEEGYEPNKADYFNAFVNSSDNVFEKAMRYGFPCNIDYDGYPIEWVESGGRMLKLIEYGSTVTEYVLSNAVSLRAYKACNRIIRLSNKGKSRALITAVEYGDLKLVNMLIDNGADINKLVEQEGGEYYAPIHAAASSPSEEILTILLKNGADLSLVDSEGNTPYDIAKKAKNKQYMKILKK